MDSRSSLLILGLGNLLCSDDGLGAFVAQAVADSRVIPEGVKVLDGGTLGLSLLPWLEDAERLDGEEVGPAVAARLSVHQVGVSDLIEAARWRERIPPTLVLLGIVPFTTELGVGLSEPVFAGLPALVDLVCEEAARLGFPLERKSDDVSNCSIGDASPADRAGVRLLQPTG
jgi:hydrogenase maturation protease